jgi:YidC/Oxa1 family membrane protein insertase
MPIFLAFYRSLYKFNYLDAANKGFLWIPDISRPDPLFILAILAGLTTYLQQKISMANNNDPTQKAMLYFMPVMMAFVAYKMPAGLPLYWVVFNTLGILQQLYVNKIHGKKKLDTSTGLEIEMPIKLAEPGTQDESGKEAGELRNKGGREKDAGPNSRKKREKR